MKIIISHDVDVLYVKEHIFRDLRIEKMMVKSVLRFLSRKIPFKVFVNRYKMIFGGRMHRLDEVMEYDRKHSIPSTFFFGMNQGLGMSYFKSEAAPEIERVIQNGFDVGVHGIDFENQEIISSEHDSFENITGMTSFGIRNHYVRFNDDTFTMMNKAGYLFDSTYFNKMNVEIRAPFKVGNMWEIPLFIMDGYVITEGKLSESIEKTKQVIRRAEESDMPYCTILFHDQYFDENCYPVWKEWYCNTVEYCEKQGYEFISFRDAVKELENER